MSKKETVVKAATLILVISIFGRILGFVREMVIGQHFGTGRLYDIYLMANTIPDFIFVVLGGSLAAALVPVFTSTDIKAGREEASRQASYITNIALLIVTVLTVLAAVAAPYLISLIAPGWSPEAREMTVKLTYILLPTVILNTMGSIAKGVLNSLQHFAAPALTSVVFSATVIMFVYTLAPFWGVYSLATGAVVACVLQLAIQIPPLGGRSLKYHRGIPFKDQGVRGVGELVFPMILQLLVLRVYVLIERVFVSGLAVGSLSALTYANKLMMLPYNLLVIPVNTAVLPSMSEMAARKDHEALGETTAFGINLMALFTLPAAVGLFVLAAPIVSLVYERGSFNALSTQMTAFALQFYVIGLFSQGAMNVLARTFYALHDSKTPFLISLIVVPINVLFSWILIRYLNHGGLALSSSLAATVNMVLIYWFLRRRLPAIPERKMFINLGKILLASLLMGVGVSYAYRYLLPVFGTAAVSGKLMGLGIAILVGTVLYFSAAVVLRAEGVSYLTGLVTRRRKLR